MNYHPTGDASHSFAAGDIVFLRPEIKVEPLMHGWHAWPHLISPLQHGLNTLQRHIPIMKSFVATPSIHVAASQNPAMAGGPFIEMPASAAPQISQFLKQTEDSCAQLINVASAYLEFDRALHSSAKGYSLDAHYDDIPDELKGVVELFYDVNSQPHIRFYEDLLYDLGLNNHMQQLYIGRMEDDKRSFFMSTPRLSSNSGFIKSIQFNDKRIDTLAAARGDGVEFSEIEDLFVEDSGLPVDPRQYLTTSAPNRRTRPKRERIEDGLNLKVEYVGHACLLLTTPDVSVLIDPVLAWDDHEDGRYTYDDLPDKIDYVAISHGHHDHFCAESLLQIRRKVGTVVVPSSNQGSVADPSMKLMLRRLGFDNALALEPFEEVQLPGGRIVSLPFPGEHADLDIYGKQGLLVELGGVRLLFLVDSHALDIRLYSHIALRYGQIDFLFVGMECQGAPLSWLYGPLLSRPLTRKDDESRRLSASKADRAWEVVGELKPKAVFLYAMGQEPYLSHLTGLAYEEDSIQLQEARRFMSLCAEGGVPARHLVGASVLVG